MKIPEMLAEYETRLIKDKLLEFPGLIKNQKDLIRKLRDAYRVVDQERVILEADLAGDIASETNPNTGKPAYSNAEARSVELIRRKKANTSYQEFAVAAKYAEHELNEAQDALEALQEKFKAYRYVVGLVTAELNVWATVEEDGEEGRYVPTEKGIITAFGSDDSRPASQPY